MKIAVVRGAFANPYELQSFEPLKKRNLVTVFGSKTSLSGDIRLFSPYDLVGKNRYLRAIANRLLIDSHWLLGLKEKLKGYDIAHCAETYYAYTQQCIKAKQKGYVKAVVCTVWENIYHNNEGIFGRKIFKQKALKNVDIFLAVTEKAKEVLISEGCDPTKIKMLKPGLDLSTFRPDNVTRKDKKVKLLMVCRLEKEKGVDQIAKILPKNVDLYIAGTGSLEEELKHYPKVHLLGKVPYEKMPDLYRSCDIFIHYPVGSKSWNEQFGMVLVEAMACGLPIIVLNKGSVKEVVGDAAIITDQKNFFENLNKLIKDPALRKSLSLKSLNLVKLKYDSIIFASNLEKFYKNLIK